MSEYFNSLLLDESLCFGLQNEDLLDLVTYVVSVGQDFIERHTNGFLRLYVPNEGYQAEQMESFVRLFESYLTRVEEKHVQVDAQRTGKGTMYIFRAEGEQASSLQIGLNEALTRFDQFMALCKDDPDEAADLVQRLGIAPDEASTLINKYARRYTRLQTDIRHERENTEAEIQQKFENKRREIKQQFEVEALELAEGIRLTFAPQAANGLGGLIIPTQTQVSLTDSAFSNNSQARELVREIIKEVIGGTKWTPEEEELLRAIRERATNSAEIISYTSDLEVINDDTAQPQTRKSALRRLQEFAERNKDAIADAAFRAALEYLPKLL